MFGRSTESRKEKLDVIRAVTLGLGRINCKKEESFKDISYSSSVSMPSIFRKVKYRDDLKGGPQVL